MELHRSGYIAQISAYIKTGQPRKAHSLSKEMEEKFPDDALAMYLAAESAYWCGDMHEAALGARKAYNRSSEHKDMIACAVLGASAYYEMRDFARALELLKAAEALGKDAQIERLMFMSAMAIGDVKEAALHLDELHRLDPIAAMELVDRTI